MLSLKSLWKFNNYKWLGAFKNLCLSYWTLFSNIFFGFSIAVRSLLSLLVYPFFGSSLVQSIKMRNGAKWNELANVLANPCIEYNLAWKQFCSAMSYWIILGLISGSYARRKTMDAKANKNNYMCVVWVAWSISKLSNNAWCLTIACGLGHVFNHNGAFCFVAFRKCLFWLCALIVTRIRALVVDVRASFAFWTNDKNELQRKEIQTEIKHPRNAWYDL